ncbi:hypothetical protein BDZ94DRAFT_403973 [Collybia nuda]|uniref:Uncharacterized protein n=1 Tax=Collybia nuda TaxID=64659 RepID=A0A9P5XT98_9AGAR|nr:hypothetical protein BDZ94DRAFT_403973 [Collybia nuda]
MQVKANRPHVTGVHRGFVASEQLKIRLIKYAVGDDSPIRSGAWNDRIPVSIKACVGTSGICFIHRKASRSRTRRTMSVTSPTSLLACSPFPLPVFRPSLFVFSGRMLVSAGRGFIYRSVRADGSCVVGVDISISILWVCRTRTLRRSLGPTVYVGPGLCKSWQPL